MGMDEIINAGPIEQNPATYEWACSKLESFRQVVPVALLASQISSFRAHLHLQIMYSMIWVNIGCGATLRLVRWRLQPTPGGSTTLQYEETYLRSQELAERSRKAATAVIDWISQLYGRNLLARFSFTDFHTCSAAVIILLLHCVLSLEHQSLFISPGIDALCFMAEGSKLAKNVLRLIERLQEAAQKCISLGFQDDTLDQQISPQVPPNQSLLQSQTLDVAEDVRYGSAIDDIVYDNYHSTIATIDLSFFPDLGPRLLEYSDKYLVRLGFDGFNSSFDPNLPHF
ncbi:hypothetical protein NW762_012373 [Fusarium torreyae]|uniref:Uncharacterized protein n=1 Tax=Fusarium torreyae TaxID=1237075 RepID=A0A9W8RR23_9HYPO|nr:hypothetical protein NW762_012373 [Fusarium torreyae]